MRQKPRYSINVGGQLLELSEPIVMGILNITPDSFYADSRKQTEAAIAQRTEEIIRQGGGIIDIGACSTRPGAASVSETEELERLRYAIPIVRHAAPSALLSIDTFRASVVQRIENEYGPFIVNDISGGADPEMFSTVAHLGLPYILTHSPWGTQSAIQSCETATRRPPFLPSMLLYYSERVDALLQLGQKDIILDPGFGFGKSLDENYELMSQLDVLQTFDLPLLVGVSRKSMIYKLLGNQPEDALNGTTVLHTLALQKGANILRVHDVGAAIEVIKILRKCSSPSV